MKADEIKAYLLRNGWTEKNQTVFEKMRLVPFRDGEKIGWRTKQYRVKFQATSYRLEVKSTIPASAYTTQQVLWTRVGGGYYKDAFISMGGAGEPDRLVYKAGEAAALREYKPPQGTQP